MNLFPSLPKTPLLKNKLEVLEEEAAAYDNQGGVTGISITFAEKKSAYLPVTDLASTVLLGDSDIVTLVVGEENFTFAVALAAQRKGHWKNIYVSKYQALYNGEVILPEFEDVRKRNMAQVVLNRTLMTEKEDTITEEVRLRRFRALCPSHSMPKIEDDCSKKTYSDLNRIRALINEQFDNDAEEARLRKLRNLSSPSLMSATYKSYADRKTEILNDEDDPSVEVDLDKYIDDESVPPVPPNPVLHLRNDFESGGWLNISISEANLPLFVINGWTEMFPNAVVFQCPCTTDGTEVATLVRDFFSSAGLLQKVGYFMYYDPLEGFRFAKTESADVGRVCRFVDEESKWNHSFLGIHNGGGLGNRQQLDGVQLKYSELSRFAEEGDYLFLGITKRVPYVQECDLVTLIGHPVYRNGPLWFAEETEEDHSHIAQAGYRFIGADADFPLRMLEYGYLHRGRYRIHELILRDHLMLCFQRKETKIVKLEEKIEPDIPNPTTQPPPMEAMEEDFGSIFIQVKLHQVKSK